MRINIVTETQAREFAREEIKEISKRFWKELDKLRKRIVELEKKNMDIKKFKGPWRNQK